MVKGIILELFSGNCLFTVRVLKVLLLMLHAWKLEPS